MRKFLLMVMLLMTLGLGACSSMHDNKGWEHMGDPETHQDSNPYIFKHEH